MAPLPVPRWVVFNICSQARSIMRPWNFPKSKFWSPTLALLDQKLGEEDPTVPVLTRRFWYTLKFGESRPRTRYGWGDRGMKNKSGHRVAVHRITWERIIVNWRPAQLVSHFKLPVINSTPMEETAHVKSVCVKNGPLPPFVLYSHGFTSSSNLLYMSIYPKAVYPDLCHPPIGYPWGCS